MPVWSKWKCQSNFCRQCGESCLNVEYLIRKWSLTKRTHRKDEDYGFVIIWCRNLIHCWRLTFYSKFACCGINIIYVCVPLNNCWAVLSVIFLNIDDSKNDRFTLVLRSWINFLFFCILNNPRCNEILFASHQRTTTWICKCMRHSIKYVIPWPFNPYIPVSCKLWIWGGVEFHWRSFESGGNGYPLRTIKVTHLIISAWAWS